MSIVDDLLVCLRFFSRLPVPAPRRETTGLAAAVAMTPVASAGIGALAATVLLGASALGLPPVLAAALGVAALVAITGALHEDGLADCADGFGGGATRERKLEIMRDSRIGTFGACALVLSLVLRVVALASIAPRQAALVMIVAALASRTAALLPLALLPPARADGLGAAAARLDVSRTVAALAGAVVLGLAASLLGLALARGAVALVLAATGALAVCALAWRQVGGQTGDVAGAAQQVAEIAVLLVFAAA